MKKDLGTGYTIEDIDSIEDCYDRCEELVESCILLYGGKTPSIPEIVACKCAKLLAEINNKPAFYQNYKYSLPQPVNFTKCTATESIISACDKPYCIIYKTKQV